MENRVRIYKQFSFLVCFIILFVFAAESQKPAFADILAPELRAEPDRQATTAAVASASAAPNAQQSIMQLEMPNRFYAYERLDYVEAPKRLVFSPQTARIIDQGGPNEYLISTYLGPRWIYRFEGYEKIVDPYRPYSYEQQIIDAIKLESMYPDLISVSEIGRSVEGRQIISIKLGKGEKSMIMVGSHHAREYISSSFLMKMIDEYAYAYHTTGMFGKYDIRALLDAVTIHAVVMLNPDGVNIVQNGKDAAQDVAALSRIRMLKPSYREWKSNINGVNLNANYPAEWAQKRSTRTPDSETFKGNAPGSEPETQALMAYTNSNDFLLAASLHSKGKVIFWADSRTMNQINGQRQIAQAVANVTGYTVLPISWEPSIYAAGYENWFRAEFKRPALCIELTPINGNNHPHNDANFDRLVWNDAKYIGAVLAAECLKR